MGGTVGGDCVGNCVGGAVGGAVGGELCGRAVWGELCGGALCIYRELWRELCEGSCVEVGSCVGAHCGLSYAGWSTAECAHFTHCMLQCLCSI